MEFNASSPHPYVLPTFMNVLWLSVPFMCEKVSKILHQIVDDLGDGLEDPS